MAPLLTSRRIGAQDAVDDHENPSLGTGAERAEGEHVVGIARVSTAMTIVPMLARARLGVVEGSGQEGTRIAVTGS